MYDIAKKARSGMKAKAERLAGEKDRKVDSSDWSPAPELKADVKTGMRPVSRQALKNGGVAGKKRADRVARKAGGRVETKGEQPLVDRYINRDLKKANEYRDGKKHDGGLKRGGRAKYATDGAVSPKYGSMEEMIKDNPAPAKKPLGLDKVPLPPRRPTNLTPAAETPKFKKDTDLNTQSYKDGGKTGEKWIQKAIKKPGALHKQMGVPEGEKIPAKKLEKAAEKGGKLGKRARLAQTLRSMHNTGGKVDDYLAKEKAHWEKVDKDRAEYSAKMDKKYPGKSPIERAEAAIKDKFSPAYFAGLKAQRKKELSEDKGYQDFASRRAKKDDDADEKCYGGRTKKADGGGVDPRLGIVSPKALNFAQNLVTPGLKKGGRVKKEVGGPARAAGAASVPSLTPVNVTPTASNMPSVGSGLLPQSSGSYTKAPVYDPDKYNPAPVSTDKTKSSKHEDKNKDPLAVPGVKKGGRVAKADGGSTRARFNEAFRAARAAYLSGEGPKTFEFEGKKYGTDLAKPAKSPMGSGPGSSRAGAPAMGSGPGSRSANVAVPAGAGPGSVAPRATYTPPRVMGTGQGVSTTATPSVTTPSRPEERVYEDSAPVNYGASLGNKRGGRIKKAYGGSFAMGGKPKAKSAKGKTNINIIISAGKPNKPEETPMAPMGAGAPPMVPPAPMMGAGAPPPLGGPAMPPMGPPPAPMGAGKPPMPMPPMPRKAGGRVTKVARSYKDMEAGAASGEGRLQKTDIAKRAPKPAFEKGLNLSDVKNYPNKVPGATGGRTARKAGGKVYRSYKDMDAGAGSGKGRLEKTEIQSRKK